jgi:hypothetical protein
MLFNDGNHQKKVIVETDQQYFDFTQQNYQNDDNFSKNNLEIILEKTDFKMTDKYVMAAKIIG